MATLTQELHEFASFVEQQVQSGISHAKLEDVLRLWRAQRERSNAIEAINEGLDDVREGRVRAADVVLSQIRDRLGKTSG